MNQRGPLVLTKDVPYPSSETVTLHFDGSCAPNPGPMGIGYILRHEKGILAYGGTQLGKGTNNEAEYRALAAGLRHALRLGVFNIHVVSDSLLVVNQTLGNWSVKQGRLKRPHAEVQQLLELFTSFTITHTHREHNMEADTLSRSVCLGEPPLPLPVTKAGRFKASLHPWQAATIRSAWMHGRTRNAYMLARVYNVTKSTIERIVTADAHRSADFSGLPRITQMVLPPDDPIYGMVQEITEISSV